MVKEGNAHGKYSHTSELADPWLSGALLAPPLFGTDKGESSYVLHLQIQILTVDINFSHFRSKTITKRNWVIHLSNK